MVFFLTLPLLYALSLGVFLPAPSQGSHLAPLSLNLYLPSCATQGTRHQSSKMTGRLGKITPAAGAVNGTEESAQSPWLEASMPRRGKCPVWDTEEAVESANNWIQGQRPALPEQVVSTVRISPQGQSKQKRRILTSHALIT